MNSPYNVNEWSEEWRSSISPETLLLPSPVPPPTQVTYSEIPLNGVAVNGCPVSSTTLPGTVIAQLNSPTGLPSINATTPRLLGVANAAGLAQFERCLVCLAAGNDAANNPGPADTFAFLYSTAGASSLNVRLPLGTNNASYCSANDVSTFLPSTATTRYSGWAAATAASDCATASATYTYYQPSCAACALAGGSWMQPLAATDQYGYCDNQALNGTFPSALSMTYRSVFVVQNISNRSWTGMASTIPAAKAATPVGLYVNVNCPGSGSASLSGTASCAECTAAGGGWFSAGTGGTAGAPSVCVNAATAASNKATWLANGGAVAMTPETCATAAQPQQQLSGGAIAGIVVGCVAAAALIAVGGFYQLQAMRFAKDAAAASGAPPPAGTPAAARVTV